MTDNLKALLKNVQTLENELLFKNTPVEELELLIITVGTQAREIEKNYKDETK